MFSKILEWIKNQFEPNGKKIILARSTTPQDAIKTFESLEEVIEENSILVETNFEKMKKSELVKLAKELNLDTNTKMTKSQLIELIKSNKDE